MLALLIGLLAVPLRVEYSVHRIKETRGQIRFRWLFGLVRFQIRVPQVAEVRPRPAPGPGIKPKSPGERRQTVDASDLYSLIKQPALRQRVVKFIRDMLRAIHARNLFLRLRIGTGDPADTGRLWAIVGPIAGMVQNLRIAVVRIEPEFMDRTLEVESRGQFSLVPIQFIAVTAAFILSPTILRAWLGLRRENA